jgi:FkbM family methyltransferase
MIEPAPTLNTRLTDFADHYPEVVFEPVAVGAEPGLLELYFDQEGSGLASLYQRDVSHVGVEMSQSVRVPIDTLDSIASKYALETIDYLKLDLEGHELEALKGANRLLEEKRIRVITFEFGGCNIDSRTYVKDFWSLLVKQYGFTFYRLAPGRRLIILERYSESLERFNWQNILACAPGVEPAWKVIR